MESLESGVGRVRVLGQDVFLELGLEGKVGVILNGQSANGREVDVRVVSVDSRVVNTKVDQLVTGPFGQGLVIVGASQVRHRGIVTERAT